MSVTKYKLEMW